MAIILDEVAGLGVRLALDDFGTGYSSLSLLQDLPVHTLKIDRSFVHSIDIGPERRAFVKAIVDLAHALELTVVAEGIDAPAQTVELQRLGCRYGQGFQFSVPLEAHALEALLASRRTLSARRPEAA